MVFKKGYTPWMKGKTHSEETRKKMSEAHKGRKFSEEHLKHMSESRKGIDYSTPYSRQRSSEVHKGQIPWSKNKPMSKENKRKLREANKGRIPWNKGKIGVYSEEVRKKMSEAMKGHIPWNKGKSRSEEYKKKMSGKNNPMYGVKGKTHPHWKGGAKIARTKCDLKRKRQLGYIPLNSYFKGAAGHHINNEIIIYIPIITHTSIWHSLDRPDTMKEINEIAFKFLCCGV